MFDSISLIFSVHSWGFTNETSTDPGRPGVAIENAPMAGVDGTCGVDDCMLMIAC